MAYTYGPLTDVLGMTLQVVSDGTGGFLLTSAKYGQLAVSGAHLADPNVAMLFERLMAAEDAETNWRSLSMQLGLGDPGVGNQVGSPE